MEFFEEFKSYQNIVDRRIEELIKIEGAPASIIDAMKYSLLAGGKRIRPILAASICKALGGNCEEAINLGCAIEFIHTYSLIHDDLPAMDNDDLRRGKPTNHKVFGEAMAILAGDGLLNYAFEIIFNETIKNHFDLRFINSANIISNASGIRGMIGGQVIDIKNEGKQVDIDILYEMHRKKTGALIEASCLTGCVLAKREDCLDIVKDYSKNLGLAFQIVDDILDETGDVAKLGKKIGSDKNNNKSTFISVIGLDKSKELANEYSQRAKNCAKKIDLSGFLCELTDYLLHRES